MILGCVVFWWWGLELQKKDQHSPNDKGGPSLVPWYSLDLFVPAVGLGVADKWQPIAPNVENARSGRLYRFVRGYTYLHKLLGWVLVPIGLAAVSGILK